MYISKINQLEDQHKVLDYVKRNGFATLVSYCQARNMATHLPLYVKEKNDELYLYGHIARANEQKLSLDGQQELLAIFMSDHAYISSSWYDHVNVPTWNYVAVHLYGTAREIIGQELADSINELVDQYEAVRKNRFHVNQMSDESREAHYKGLVAFEMKVQRIEAAEKLSQNRKDHDYYNVIDHLKKADQASQKTANHMLNSRPKK